MSDAWIAGLGAGLTTVGEGLHKQKVEKDKQEAARSLSKETDERRNRLESRRQEMKARLDASLRAPKHQLVKTYDKIGDVTGESIQLIPQAVDAKGNLIIPEGYAGTQMVGHGGVAGPAAAGGNEAAGNRGSGGGRGKDTGGAGDKGGNEASNKGGSKDGLPSALPASQRRKVDSERPAETATSVFLKNARPDTKDYKGEDWIEIPKELYERVGTDPGAKAQVRLLTGMMTKAQFDAWKYGGMDELASVAPGAPSTTETGTDTPARTGLSLKDGLPSSGAGVAPPLDITPSGAPTTGVVPHAPEMGGWSGGVRSPDDFRGQGPRYDPSLTPDELTQMAPDERINSLPDSAEDLAETLTGALRSLEIVRPQKRQTVLDFLAEIADYRSHLLTPEQMQTIDTALGRATPGSLIPAQNALPPDGAPLQAPDAANPLFPGADASPPSQVPPAEGAGSFMPQLGMQAPPGQAPDLPPLPQGTVPPEGAPLPGGGNPLFPSADPPQAPPTTADSAAPQAVASGFSQPPAQPPASQAPVNKTVPVVAEKAVPTEPGVLTSVIMSSQSELQGATPARKREILPLLVGINRYRKKKLTPATRRILSEILDKHFSAPQSSTQAPSHAR